MFSIFALKIISWILLIAPWLTLFFMKKEHIKRYMPVSIFGALLVTMWNEFAYTYKWWEFKTTLLPGLVTNISFIYGAFLVGTIWIFYFTFRNFWLYLITNIIMDALLAFPLNALFERIGLYKLIHYNSWKILFTALVLSIVFYIYQLWQEEVLVKRQERENNKGYK